MLEKVTSVHVKVGDWIRFYRDGVQVAVVTDVVTQRRYPHATEAVTEYGHVDIDDILEIRRAE